MFVSEQCRRYSARLKLDNEQDDTDLQSVEGMMNGLCLAQRVWRVRYRHGCAVGCVVVV